MDREHGAHEDDARQVIRSLVPAWREQPLDAMHWLTGGDNDPLFDGAFSHARPMATMRSRTRPSVWAQRACLDIGPVHAVAHAQAAAGAEGCARLARQRLAPAGGQGLEKDFAGRGRAAPAPARKPLRRARAAPPAGGGAAGAPARL